MLNIFCHNKCKRPYDKRHTATLTVNTVFGTPLYALLTNYIKRLAEFRYAVPTDGVCVCEWKTHGVLGALSTV